MTTNGNADRRVQRTQSALLGAFGGLILERRYDEIRVADILEAAQVGRSTFYEHFRSKEDLLGHSLAPLFSILANATRADCDLERVEFLVRHFWENRRLARPILLGSPARQVTRLLAAAIERQLLEIARRRGATLRLDQDLAAMQIAGAQLALLQAWLAGGSNTTATELAAALHATTVASIDSLFAQA